MRTVLVLTKDVFATKVERMQALAKDVSVSEYFGLSRNVLVKKCSHVFATKLVKESQWKQALSKYIPVAEHFEISRNIFV